MAKSYGKSVGMGKGPRAKSPGFGKKEAGFSASVGKGSKKGFGKDVGSPAK